MKIASRIALATLVALSASAATAVALAPIDPMKWAPPPSHLPADACETAPAAEARVLVDGLPGKPDGLAFAPDGRLIAALTNGDVIAIDPRQGGLTRVATGGGFLTGLAAASDSTIYTVDERAGALLKAPLGGTLKTVTDRAGAMRLSWTNDVAIARNKSVYLTTTATGRSLDDFYLEVLEHRGSGLLVRHNPRTGVSDVVTRGLAMTNGLAATPDGRLLIAESSTYGVSLFDADGRRGSGIAGLPGFTGNVRASDQPNRYWVTLLSPRSGLIDGLAEWPWARRLLSWMPAGMRPGPAALPCLVEIVVEGDRLRAKALRIAGVATSFSTAIERDGRIYMSPASIAPGASPRVYTAKLPPTFR